MKLAHIRAYVKNYIDRYVDLCFCKNMAINRDFLDFPIQYIYGSFFSH